MVAYLYEASNALYHSIRTASVQARMHQGIMSTHKNDVTQSLLDNHFLLNWYRKKYSLPVSGENNIFDFKK